MWTGGGDDQANWTKPDAVYIACTAVPTLSIDQSNLAVFTFESCYAFLTTAIFFLELNFNAVFDLSRKVALIETKIDMALWFWDRDKRAPVGL